MPLRISPKILEAALTESVRRGDGHILHPEHLLVAVAETSVLRERGLNRDAIRRHVDQLLGPPVAPFTRGGVNDNTSRILAAASRQAERRGALATADDVLLSLIDESEGPQIAPALLKNAGVDVDALRRLLENSPG